MVIPTLNVIDEYDNLDMNNNIVFRNNILYNTKDEVVSPEVAATATIENNVTFTDNPGFIDIENGIYLLKYDAEVYDKIEGFEPLYFTRMGMYSDRAYSRTKNAHVYCKDSPYAIQNGEKIKSETNLLVFRNGQPYVPLRSAVAAIGGEIFYDEATETITVGTETKSMSFIDGEKEKVTLNGVEYTLKAPLFNESHTNYISIADICEMLEKHFIKSGDIYILSSTEELFDEVNDAGLLRYLEEQLSIY